MDPLEVMSNIENKLGITAVPASWPIGYGSDFQGVYDLIGKKLHLYQKTEHGAREAETRIMDFQEGLDTTPLSKSYREHLDEEIMLIEDEIHGMDATAFDNGKITPVFFGSALNNFGLDIFLNYFAKYAPQPQTYESSESSEYNLTNTFSGFVFKLQANMNPEHRDCTAFMRVASGVFERGMVVTHQATGKQVRMAAPQSLMADDRQILEKAYPGDIVALFNPGYFKIGDTLFHSSPVRFDVIPLFTPEHFMKVLTKDPFKRKQFREGLTQLSEEGVVHVFEVPNGMGNELLLGTVGALQFDVVKHRMMAEYKVVMDMQPTNYFTARWLPNEEVASKLESSYSTEITRDLEGNPIALFHSNYALRQAEEKVGEKNLLKFKTH
jgi:peptide chain release factor 3